MEKGALSIIFSFFFFHFASPRPGRWRRSTRGSSRRAARAPLCAPPAARTTFSPASAEGRPPWARSRPACFRRGGRGTAGPARSSTRHGRPLDRGGAVPQSGGQWLRPPKATRSVRYPEARASARRYLGHCSMTLGVEWAVPSCRNRVKLSVQCCPQDFVDRQNFPATCCHSHRHGLSSTQHGIRQENGWSLRN